MNSPIVIIGGGVTGLTAAHRLVRKGHNVRLLEASPRLGGLIRSERDGEWLIEYGPNSLLDNKPVVSALLTELGLSNDRQYSQAAAKKRFLVSRGQAVAAPTSPFGALSTPLLSFPGKLRVLGDLFRRRRLRDTDLSLADFCADHFGAEFVRRLLDPLISGIYAGDPTQLSARHAFPILWEAEQTHGSIIRGLIGAARAHRAAQQADAPADQPKTRRQRARIYSFPEGLETIPRALAATLPPGSVQLNSQVTRLVPPSAPDQPWQVEYQTPANKDPHAPPSTLSASAVVLALPAAALASLLIDNTHPLSIFENLEYPAVASLFLGYKRSQIRHPLDGFGMLAPSGERRNLLGILFSSSLFPGRAPDDHVALTVLVGGTRHPDIAHLPRESLMELIRIELLELLGVSGNPVYAHHHINTAAIPQYKLGHEKYLATLDAAEARYPGLHIGGPIRDGIAVYACIAAGEKLAQRVLNP